MRIQGQELPITFELLDIAIQLAKDSRVKLCYICESRETFYNPSNWYLVHIGRIDALISLM